MTPAEKALPVEELRQLIELRDGALIWLARTPATHRARDCHRWNTRYAGKPALIRRTVKGYDVGTIRSKQYAAHRVIWALVTGAWPQNQIDHINGDPADNRIENLREATLSENARNQKRHRTNTSGRTGVHFQKANNKFAAYVRVENRKHHLGYFTTLSEAAQARANAERALNFHPNHGAVR